MKFLFFVAIFMLFSHLKRKKNKTGEKTVSDGDSIWAKISKSISELVEELETEKKAHSAKESGEGNTFWESLSEDDDSSREGLAGRGDVTSRSATNFDIDEDIELGMDDAISSPPIPVSVATASERPARWSASGNAGYQKKKKEKTDFYAVAPESRNIPDVEQLRKAIIWSEILAPPVALRSDHLEKAG